MPSSPGARRCYRVVHSARTSRFVAVISASGTTPQSPSSSPIALRRNPRAGNPSGHLAGPDPGCRRHETGLSACEPAVGVSLSGPRSPDRVSYLHAEMEMGSGNSRRVSAAAMSAVPVIAENLLASISLLGRAAAFDSRSPPLDRFCCWKPVEGRVQLDRVEQLLIALQPSPRGSPDGWTTPRQSLYDQPEHPTRITGLVSQWLLNRVDARR